MATDFVESLKTSGSMVSMLTAPPIMAYYDSESDGIMLTCMGTVLSKEYVIDLFNSSMDWFTYHGDDMPEKFNAESEKMREERRTNYSIQKTKRIQSGYIYLLKSDKGLYKIGRTKNPSDRMKTFSVKLPFEVEYTHVFPSSDTISHEKWLHDYFASKRINGEWFNLSPEDVTYIKSIEVM